MKMRILAASLCLLLALTACGQQENTAEPETEPVQTPEYAFTAPDTAYDLDSAEEIVFSESETKVTVSKAGTYRVSGRCADGQLYVAAGKDGEVTLILDGLDLTSSTAPLVVEQAARVTVVLADGSENKLADGSGYELSVDGSTVDGVIFSKADLVLTGSGSLTVTGNAAHGIVSKDTLEITGGSYDITAVKSGVDGKDCLMIADAKITVTSGTDGLKSSNEEDPDLGYVYVRSGEITIDAGDNGVQAALALTVDGGSITVLGSEEALEGATVTVNGGDLHLTARDDGINGAGAPDSSTGGNGMAADSTAGVEIHDGYVWIDAEGDGVDSNGSLTMTGGVLLVNGPTNSGNGALDYASDAVITGGVVMAVGSSGMAASFGPNSTQGVIATALEPQSGVWTLALCGEDGQVLAAFTPSKSYSHLVVSAPGIEDGGTYTICTGTLTGGDENGYAAEGTLADAAVLAEITMDGLNYGGMGGMFGGKGGGGRGGDFGGFGRVFQGGEKPEMPEDGERPEGPGGDQRRENGELPEMPGDGEMPLPEDPNIKGA